MSLKKLNEENEVYSTQIYPPLEPLSLSMPQEELSRLWTQITLLKADERQAAEDKFQVSLMFATMNQICQALTDFMTATERQLKIINNQQISIQQITNEKQMKLISLQNLYAKEVRTEAVKITNDSYANIEKRQSIMLDKILKDLEKATARMTKNVDSANNACKSSAYAAWDSSKKLFQFKKWWDLIWYASPIAVLLNLIFRIYQHFSGG